MNDTDEKNFRISMQGYDLSSMIGGFFILRNLGLKRKLYIDIPVSCKISSVEEYLGLSYPNMVYHFLRWSQNVGGGEEHCAHYECYPSSFLYLSV